MSCWWRTRPSAFFCILRILCALLALGGPISRTVLAQTRFEERDVKATFVFNFAQFVEWPEASFADAQHPIVIGVLGENPFGTALDDIVNGEIIGGRPLSVQRFARVEDITVCHILFVSGSERSRLPQIFAALKGRPILTVSDVPGFAARGGMIGFATEQRSIHLQVNLTVARASGLTISSNILRTATIVAGGGPA